MSVHSVRRKTPLPGSLRIILVCGIVIGVAALTSFADFGWIDAAQLLTAGALLRMVARGHLVHPRELPFSDGTLIAAASAWLVLICSFNLIDYADASTQLVIAGAAAVAGATGLRLRTLEAPY